MSLKQWSVTYVWLIDWASRQPMSEGTRYTQTIDCCRSSRSPFTGGPELWRTSAPALRKRGGRWIWQATTYFELLRNRKQPSVTTTPCGLLNVKGTKFNNSSNFRLLTRLQVIWNMCPLTMREAWRNAILQ